MGKGNRSRGAQVAPEASDAPAPDVEPKVEETDAPPVEGEVTDGFLPPTGDETELPPPAVDQSAPTDGDERTPEASDAPTPELSRHLFHDEGVLVERALSLAKRMAEHEGLDQPTAQELDEVRRRISIDVLRDRAVVEAWCDRTEASLPVPKIVGYRVWEHGEFHHDGKVFRPGDVVTLTEEQAAPHGIILIPVTE